MSSWLARSLANSLGIDDQEEEEEEERDNNLKRNDDTNTRSADNHIESTFTKLNHRRHYPDDEEDEEGPDSPSRGVQDDLSEIKETLTRQLWGVANFLAPPPAPPPPPPSHHPAQSTSSTSSISHSDVLRDSRLESQVHFYHHHRRIASSDSSTSGLEEDESPVRGQNGTAFEAAGGGGKFGSEYSLRSEDNGPVVFNNLRLAGIYDRLGPVNEVVEEEEQDEDEDDNEDWICQAAGITEEVLTFAGNVAHHPETWLDFPIEEEEDLDDFDMSESQKLHGLAVERLTPRLAALRFELCPAHMSVGYFWMVYFVLLHSRLNKHDAELLSTPQIMHARTKWMQELQKRAKEEQQRQQESFRYYREVDDSPREGFTPTSSHFEHSVLWTSVSDRASSSTTIESENDKHLAVSTDLQFVDKAIVEEKPVPVAANNGMLAGPSYKVVLPNFGDDDDDDDWPEDDEPETGKCLPAIQVGIDEDFSFSDLEDDDCIIPSKPKVVSKD